MPRPALLVGLFALAAGCRSGWDNGVTVYNGPPAVTITEPADDSTFAEGQSITFRGLVHDDRGVENLSIEWYSSIDGSIPLFLEPDEDGNVELSTASLTIGNHVVTLRAIDEEVASAEDDVLVHVEGIPDNPLIKVEHPFPGEMGGSDAPFRFMVTVTDEQDPSPLLVVRLDSDASGFVCSMTPDSIGIAYCEELLALGPHLLTFTVTDTEGFTATATAMFEVKSPLDIDNDLDGFTENQGDCDDTNSTIYPGAKEICDGRDQDCNPVTPIDSNTECYDDDGDGYTELDGDCNDAAATINPAAPEIPDGVDNNCNGQIDEGTSRFDDDGDGYCETPPCTNAAGTKPDCNDADYLTSPGATEVCGDGADNNCNGTQIEKDAIGCTRYWYDNDRDGYGTGSTTECWCSPGEFPFTGGTNDDCYDNNANAHPGQTAYFDTHRGDGKFDYNCDFGETEQWIDTHVCSQSWSIICDDTPGWEGSTVPKCGATASFIGNCDVTVDLYACFMYGLCDPTCQQNGKVGRRQACR